MIATVIPIVDILPQDRVRAIFQKGEPFEEELTIEPRLPDPFLIKSIKVPKGYLKVKLTPPPAGEGGKGDVRKYRLKISFADDVPVQRLTDTIFLTTNYEKMPNLRIRIAADVRGPIQVRPTRIYYSKLAKEKKTSQKQTIQLSYIGDGSFKIKNVQAKPDHFEPEIEELAKGKDYLVHLYYKGDYSEKTIRGNLTVTTDNEIQPVISVPISGRMLSDITKRKSRSFAGDRRTMTPLTRGEKIPAP